MARQALNRSETTGSGEFFRDEAYSPWYMEILVYDYWDSWDFWDFWDFFDHWDHWDHWDFWDLFPLKTNWQ